MKKYLYLACFLLFARYVHSSISIFTFIYLIILIMRNKTTSYKMISQHLINIYFLPFVIDAIMLIIVYAIHNELIENNIYINIVMMSFLLYYALLIISTIYCLAKNKTPSLLFNNK